MHERSLLFRNDRLPRLGGRAHGFQPPGASSQGMCRVLCDTDLLPSPLGALPANSFPDLSGIERQARCYTHRAAGEALSSREESQCPDCAYERMLTNREGG